MNLDLEKVVNEGAPEEVKRESPKKRAHRVINIKRPVVPHLHLVNLRPEEAMIDRVLFKAGKGGKTPPMAYTTKTIIVDNKTNKAVDAPRAPS